MSRKNETIRFPGRRPAGRPTRAFTLVELIVVMAIVGLVLAVVLPTMINLFSAGADAQAYNVMSALLASARAEAISTVKFVGVHVQMADAVDAEGKPLSPDLQGVSYAAMVSLQGFARSTFPPEYLDSEEFNRGADEMVDRFVRAEGPYRMPQKVAFGELKSTYVTESAGVTEYLAMDDPGFTSFTLVFSPGGAVTKKVKGKNVRFRHDTALFSGAQALWDLNVAHNNDHPVGEPGATAMTMFDYERFAENDKPEAEGGIDADYRAKYLNQCGQFLTINVYTGQLNKRK